MKEKNDIKSDVSRKNTYVNTHLSLCVMSVSNTCAVGSTETVKSKKERFSRKLKCVCVSSRGTFRYSQKVGMNLPLRPLLCPPGHLPRELALGSGVTSLDALPAGSVGLPLQVQQG